MSKRARYCVGCGRLAPRRPVQHGWTTTHLAAKGKGQRWYRQCGCMSALAYYELTNHLFAEGLDYPARLRRCAREEEP